MKLLKNIYPVLIVLALISCDPENIIDDTTSSNSSTQIESSTDYEWLTDSQETITLSGTTITSNSENVSINGSVATINQPGYYVLSGTLSNGQIVVDVDSGIVKIKLSDVSITNTSGSPFYVKSSDKTIIFLEDGTSNNLTDASSYASSGEPNATLFSNSYLAFTGTGSLTIKGNYNDGISSDDEIIIQSGTYTVTAKDDAIRGKNYLRIADGTVTASAGTGHALKSDNETKAGYGYILISGGTLNLTSTSADGIHAVKRVIFNGGTATISAVKSQGLKSDSLVVVNGGVITVSSSHEGIESPYITINDGEVNINASDDGLNSSFGNGSENNDNSMLTLAGGYVYINATGGDGLDSNGNMKMTGGTVIVHGPSQQPEVPIDYNGTFSLSGGFLIASGTSSNMTQGASSSSTQYSLKITTSSSVSSGTLFHIQDASGNNIVTFKGNRSFGAIIFSSPDLVKGSSYSIYTGGSCTGTLKNGIYSGGTYNGGTSKKTFTVSSTITSITF